MLFKNSRIAYDCWCEIPAHFPFVVLDDFVIMPNHIHGILIFDKPENKSALTDSEKEVVEPKYFSVQRASFTGNPINKFGPQSQNLGSVIRGFKIGVTIRGREIDPRYSWQSDYFDRIIRDEEQYHTIKNYIRSNPANWGRKKKKRT